MKATIRHWQPKRYYGLQYSNNKHLKQGLKALRMVQDDVNAGPELVLTCIHHWPEEPVSPPGIVERQCNSFEGRDRFESFGSLKQQRKLLQKKKVNAAGNSTVEENVKTSKPQQLLPQLPPIVIPLADIVVVDVYHGNTKHMNLTTKSYGFFELRFETHNSYDVMLACLAATLPENRIFGMVVKPETKTAASQASFDVDTLTATRIAERMQSETFLERLRRRMRRFCINVEESKFKEVVQALVFRISRPNHWLPFCSVSGNLADNCGCGNNQHLDSTSSEIRDSAPPMNLFNCALEMDDEVSTYPEAEKRRIGSDRKLSMLPSGLSVESADPSVAVFDDKKKAKELVPNIMPKLEEVETPVNAVKEDEDDKNANSLSAANRCNGTSSLMVESPQMETSA